MRGLRNLGEGEVSEGLSRPPLDEANPALLGIGQCDRRGQPIGEVGGRAEPAHQRELGHRYRCLGKGEHQWDERTMS